jgi:hypothetical protein
VNGLGGVCSKGGNDASLSKLESGGDSASSGPGEVVAVRSADVLEQAVHAQALDHAGDLGTGQVREQLAEVANQEAADVELNSPREIRHHHTFTDGDGLDRTVSTIVVVLG